MSWAMSLRFSNLFILSYVSVLSTDQPRNCVKDLVRRREGNKWNSHNISSSRTQKFKISLNMYDTFLKKHKLNFCQNSSNEQPHLCSQLWLAPQQSSSPALESAQALRASMLWRLKDPLSSSGYRKLFLGCCRCLHTCGNVSVTMVAAGQELSHQTRAGGLITFHMYLLTFCVCFQLVCCPAASSNWFFSHCLFVWQKKSIPGNVLIDNRCQELNTYISLKLP